MRTPRLCRSAATVATLATALPRSAAIRRGSGRFLRVAPAGRAPAPPLLPRCAAGAAHPGISSQGRRVEMELSRRFDALPFHMTRAINEEEGEPARQLL